jgi:hypothetical protein
MAAVPRRDVLAPLLASFAVLAAHAALFGSWLPDAAGIPLAYARELAAGHGLVAQAGAPPVEGFDSPLWTLVLSLAAPIGPKLAGLACAGLAFAWILGARSPAGAAAAWRAALPAGLLALDSDFAAGTVSGLETGLLAATGAMSCALGARAAEDPRLRTAAVGGGAAALLALSRAEAVFFAAIPPLVWAAGTTGTQVAWRRRVLAYLAGFLPLVGGWQALRMAYFGEALPPGLIARLASPSALLDTGALGGLLAGRVGSLALPASAFLGLGLLALVRRGRLTPLRLAVALHLGAALALHQAFGGAGGAPAGASATLAALFIYWMLAEILEGLWVEGRRSTPGQRRFAAGLALAGILASAGHHLALSRAFASSPPLSLERSAALARGYAEAAEELGIAQVSLLSPDAGGALLACGCRVLDLAGRLDSAIAGTLWDPPALGDYVLGTERPTFVQLRADGAGHEAAAVLRSDPRLARDYAPLVELPSASSPPRTEPALGIYVRRDALGERPAALVGGGLAAAAGPAPPPSR